MNQPKNLEAYQDELAAGGGPQFWKSLDELAQTPKFQESVRKEFYSEPVWTDPVSRRHFLKLMGASFALAGLTGCTRQPKEEILPYKSQPEYMVPGKPLFFASAFPFAGSAKGILVESHEGRPTKIEGNPEHPGSLGASDAFTQAQILSLYDPDRAQIPRHRGRIATWDGFWKALSPHLQSQEALRGAGLRILYRGNTSPTFAQQISAVRQKFPQMQTVTYEPVNRENLYRGSKIAFGESLNPVYSPKNARVILSLDSDFLHEGPGSVRYAREFAQRRNPENKQSFMTRLYAVETAPTLTAGMADHRIGLGSAALEVFTQHLAAAFHLCDKPSLALNKTQQEFLDQIIKELKAHSGNTLIVAGEHQTPWIQALALSLNAQLGNVGSTLYFTKPLEGFTDNQHQSLAELTKDMRERRVDVLLVLSGNPVYETPADLEFGKALEGVGFKAQLSGYADETSRRMDWHLPETHLLESWSDARAHDGTLTLIQPLIAPLYKTKTSHEILSGLIGEPAKSNHDILHESWPKLLNSLGTAANVRRALHDGLVAKSAFEKRPVSVDVGRLKSFQPKLRKQNGIEILFRPDPTIWDGRFANNGWLQELPKPLTKLTWDNAALMSPKMAKDLGVENEQVIRISLGERSVEAPVWILPGHLPEAVTLHLGYGRTDAGYVGSQLGFDANQLRLSSSPWSLDGASIEKTRKTHPLACTQDHHSMEGRALVRSAPMAYYKDHPDFAKHMAHEPDPDLTFYPDPYKDAEYAWGMTVNLNACTGCNACVIACQSENNIPVVGKKEVKTGREMHWMRIDRYFEGDVNDPQIHHQPVMCMHCENAPCEPVCPVGATTHSVEGLNEMTYNRCVGTRYCSNNCPYKVRRFNFLQYSNTKDEVVALGKNPDVTVRSRGVMEKCTYCVQRIQQARIETQLEGRPIKDADLQTACQASCPTQAIVFGNLNDAESAAAKARKSPLNYGLLAELQTKPRTTYLAKVSNPNPDTTPAKHQNGHH